MARNIRKLERYTIRNLRIDLNNPKIVYGCLYNEQNELIFSADFCYIQKRIREMLQEQSK